MLGEVRDFDVVIAGGGMVGAALAAALAGSELRVGLVERSTPEYLEPGSDPDLRVSAISRASQRILDNVGAWQRMDASRLGPFSEMRVWDAEGHGQIHFTSADIGEALLGWIIENRLIQEALLERLHTASNVSLFLGSSMSDAVADHASVRVDLADGQTFRTRLLVGADGGESQVRTFAGLGADGWSYQQLGIVATIRTEQPHQQTARQRFLSGGPLALLPLFNGQCSIVWSAPVDQAKRLLDLPAPEFEMALTAASGRLLGAIELVSERAAFPLRLRHAKGYCARRMVLVGDAAHQVHPLAGQGVNLGFLDAAALAEVLLEAHGRCVDIGARSVLRRYERWRKGHNLLMLGIMDAFQRGFTAESLPLRRVRSWGLNLTDSARPVKSWIVRRAMGLEGDLPRLARRASL